ncbi:MAG TPA: protein kinase family protein [Micromonosporaceae bacterium]
MSHDGDAHLAAPGEAQSARTVMTFGAAAAGDVLAGRYQLDEHIDTDSAGRQIWRGIDMVLRRPVALVLREPGGEAAAGMLTTAVATSRLVHPHMVSVYDAIDEGHRAYLVREWVPGAALRDLLRQAPLDAERSTLVTHAIAEAVAALHAAGITHGNIHPGTILVADDGRVVLADTHADNPVAPSADVRAIGAVLYACLTSHWPYAEAGHATLPDAVRDHNGRLATPRQVRGGIPNHLDEITAELLDHRVEPPPAAAIAAEFARLANEGLETAYDDDNGPIAFSHNTEAATPRRRAIGKLALGVAVLTTIAIVGGFIGARLLSSPSPAQSTPETNAGSSSPASPGPGKPIQLRADQVRVVDPPRGDRAELRDAELAVDGDPNTGWSTDDYNAPYFGGSKAGAGLKPGMGILIDLGQLTNVGAVKVELSQKNASVGLRTGTSAPESSSEGDKTISTTFRPIGAPLEDHSGTVMVFPVQQEVRYLLVWITKLPANNDGKYVLAVNEISVLAP